MMDRVPLLYLDTSFLSNITKAEMGTLGESANAERWRALLACLRQEVQRGTLICPASQFQTQEALLANNINIFEFTIIQSELAKDYFLRDWQEILIHQAANQVLIYLGRQHEINRDWDILTKQLPPIIPPPFSREAKTKFLQQAEAQQRQKPPKTSFDEEYKWQKFGVILTTFRTDKGFMERLTREARISMNEAANFFESDAVDMVPFIHIFASICASLRFYGQKRKPKTGDWVDIAALASSIPDCSFITTDKNMAEIIRQLKLDTTYRAIIFNPTIPDIDALIKRLEAFTH